MCRDMPAILSLTRKVAALTACQHALRRWTVHAGQVIHLI
jgi:hypothetical protein